MSKTLNKKPAVRKKTALNKESVVRKSTKVAESLKFLPGEKWAELNLGTIKTVKHYAVSNHGRVISYEENLKQGTLLKHGFVSHFPAVVIGRTSNGRKTLTIHRLVAKYFLRQPSPQHNFVIHLDHVKHNNHYSNLKWATHEAQIDHAKRDPIWLTKKNPMHKLSVVKVKAIKEKMLAGKKVKALAKQYGVSEMQIYRIKSGENWSHIEVD
jgi:hypothetical protein